MRSLALCLAAVAVLAVISAAASAGPDRSTKVVVVTPVAASGALQPGYRITQRFSSGRCHAGSDTVRGAYRCFAANYVFDPCWPSTEGGPVSAVCTTAPWSKKLAEIQRPGKLAKTPASLPPSPIGIQLTNGVHCVIGDGALSRFQGAVVRWACGRGGNGLLGQPSRASGLWTIPRVRYDAKAKKLVAAGIGKVAVFYEGRAIRWK